MKEKKENKKINKTVNQCPWFQVQYSLVLVLFLFSFVSTGPAGRASAATVAAPYNPVGFFTGQGHGVKVAISGQNLPVVAFHHHTEYRLYFVRCGNFACTSRTVNVVDTTDMPGRYLSMSINNNGFAVLSYISLTNGNLVVLQCTNYDCTSKSRRVVNTTGKYTSIAIRKSTNFPVIAYLGSTNSQHVASCNSLDCSTTNTNVLIDGLAGEWNSIQVRPSNGFPVIAHHTSTKYSKLVLCSDLTCAGPKTYRFLNQGTNNGMYTSLVLDGLEHPIVSYYDAINLKLKVSRCNDPTLCSTWSTYTVCDITSNVGAWSSIALKNDGNPIISSILSDTTDGTNVDITDGRLFIAECGNPQCSQVFCALAPTVDNNGVTIADGHKLTSIAVPKAQTTYVVAFGTSTSLRVLTDTYSIVCPTNSAVLTNVYDSTTGYAICLCSSGYFNAATGTQKVIPALFETCSPVVCTPSSTFYAYEDTTTTGANKYDVLCRCNSGYTSPSGDRIANLAMPTTDDTCAFITCPANSVFTSTYDNSNIGYPICRCNPGYASTSGDRLAYLFSSETCSAFTCPTNSVATLNYDQGGDGYPICQCNMGFKSNSGDRLAAQSSLDTCTAVSCPTNSVFSNSYDGNNFPICQCNVGYKSTSGDRLASVPSETCSAVSCPANSVFNNTYDNGGIGYPVCECAVGYTSNSGDRLASLSSSPPETCATVSCPSNSVFYGYHAVSNYPICQCNSGFKSSSGDRLASVSSPSETCSAVTSCPANSVFNNTYDNGGIGYPVCECAVGYTSNSGDRIASLSSSPPETCTTVSCPSNSVFYGYDAVSNYPICQCNPNYKSTSGDRLALLLSTTTPETCSAVTCPTASFFSGYDNTNGYPYCQCNTGYSGKTGVVVVTSDGQTYINETGSCQWVCPANSEVVTVNNSPACQCIEGYVATTGQQQQTVDQDGTCIIDCPANSQLVNSNNNDYCECNKGYYGDTESTRRVTTTPVTGVCTYKCGYKGAACTTTADCCKPTNKFVCQNNQCTVCRKLGAICTRNKQCCSGRCNRKASICREEKKL